MKYKRRNRLYAITLLMVMLMQMGIRVVHLHFHDNTALTECSDCQHNKVHSNHLISWDDAQDDCIVCQLLATPFLQADDVLCEFFSIDQQQFFSYVVDIADCNCPLVNTRGPPSLL